MCVRFHGKSTLTAIDLSCRLATMFPHTPPNEVGTVSKKVLLMLVGLLSLAGFAGCSPAAPNNDTETPAADDSAGSEGSGTQVNEDTPSEGSGH